MENLPITIIVKAPNQQIEDQTIKCEQTWTINKLKQHLSEVYPSKPAKDEQKLIYSGQLLGDSDILKDVLRQYEGQDTHTVHLVCTPKYTKEQYKQKQKTETHHSSSVSATTQSNAPREGETPQQRPTTTNAQNTNAAPPPTEQRIPNMPWVQMGPMGPVDPAHYAMHLAWMQQAYMQYLNQYMQLAANSYATANMPAPVAVPQQPNNVVAPDTGPQPNIVPQQEPAAAQPPPAPAQRDPDNPERDWLDVFYIFSRVLVLFSVVYFYSSPVRFIFVLLIGFGLYLYHIGFFRTNNNNNNNTVPANSMATVEEQAPSRLNVVWTFLTTFFASLIPEIPNPI